MVSTLITIIKCLPLLCCCCRLGTFCRSSERRRLFLKKGTHRMYKIGTAEQIFSFLFVGRVGEDWPIGAAAALYMRVEATTHLLTLFRNKYLFTRSSSSTSSSPFGLAFITPPTHSSYIIGCGDMYCILMCLFSNAALSSCQQTFLTNRETVFRMQIYGSETNC